MRGGEPPTSSQPRLRRFFSPPDSPRRLASPTRELATCGEGWTWGAARTLRLLSGCMHLR